MDEEKTIKDRFKDLCYDFLVYPKNMDIDTFLAKVHDIIFDAHTETMVLNNRIRNLEEKVNKKEDKK